MIDNTKWREDFPTRWTDDNYTTRREFTKFLVMVSGATFVGNGYFVLQRLRRSEESFPSIEIGKVTDVAPGSVKLFRYPTDNDPAILIRLSDGQFVAYLQRCTHLSCPVQFAAKKGRLECPCHNGAFDAATGAVVEGPPPRPLPRIALRLENGVVFAEGLHGS